MDVNIENLYDPGFGLHIMSFDTQAVSPQKKNIVDFTEIKMSILKDLIQKIKIQATNW